MRDVPHTLSIRARNLKKPAFSSEDRVLIVTAHPDDESMFFSPTILSLVGGKNRPSTMCSLLCLSNGKRIRALISPQWYLVHVDHFPQEMPTGRDR